DFADETFERQFKSESIVAKLSSSFTLITIIISVLGLFGLAAFSAERRSKEISIRRVLGATMSGLAILLCRDFTRLAVFGVVFGCPIAYFIMEEFLSRYPYRTEMNPYTFLTPGLTMLLLSVAIVSYQSVKASMANPVDALRTE